MIQSAAALKAYHAIGPVLLSGALFSGATSEAAALYPDLKAFLIYACYGSLGGAALAVWTPKFRTVLRFLAVLFTGAATAGFVGPAAADILGPAIAPLCAFLSALLGPSLILDPFGTMHKVLDLMPKIHLGTGTKVASLDTEHMADLVRQDEEAAMENPENDRSGNGPQAE